MIRRIWDITLTVKDLRKSISFYRDILGLQMKYMFKDYAGFDCCGVEIGLKTWGEMEKPRKGEPCMVLKSWRNLRMLLGVDVSCCLRI